MIRCERKFLVCCKEQGKNGAKAQGENAPEKSSAKDLAEALYGIVAKHGEPEDVLYAMLMMHRKDASNAFKAALQAFGITWERKTGPADKVPA